MQEHKIDSTGAAPSEEVHEARESARASRAIHDQFKTFTGEWLEQNALARIVHFDETYLFQVWQRGKCRFVHPETAEPLEMDPTSPRLRISSETYDLEQCVPRLQTSFLGAGRTHMGSTLLYQLSRDLLMEVARLDRTFLAYEVAMDDREHNVAASKIMLALRDGWLPVFNVLLPAARSLAGDHRVAGVPELAAMIDELTTEMRELLAWGKSLKPEAIHFPDVSKIIEKTRTSTFPFLRMAALTLVTLNVSPRFLTSMTPKEAGAALGRLRTPYLDVSYNLPEDLVQADAVFAIYQLGRVCAARLARSRATTPTETTVHKLQVDSFYAEPMDKLIVQIYDNGPGLIDKDGRVPTFEGLAAVFGARKGEGVEIAAARKAVEYNNGQFVVGSQSPTKKEPGDDKKKADDEEEVPLIYWPTGEGLSQYLPKQGRGTSYTILIPDRRKKP